jgi:hypothetical protein
MIGGFHVDDSTCRACAVVAGGSADLAVQQIVGLLPQRRTRLGGRGLACVACGRTAIKPRGLDPFTEKSAFKIGMAGASGPAIFLILIDSHPTVDRKALGEADSERQ